MRNITSKKVKLAIDFEIYTGLNLPAAKRHAPGVVPPLAYRAQAFSDMAKVSAPNVIYGGVRKTLVYTLGPLGVNCRGALSGAHPPGRDGDRARAALAVDLRPPGSPSDDDDDSLWARSPWDRPEAPGVPSSGATPPVVPVPTPGPTALTSCTTPGSVVPPGFDQRACRGTKLVAVCAPHRRSLCAACRTSAPVGLLHPAVLYLAPLELRTPGGLLLRPTLAHPLCPLPGLLQLRRCLLRERAPCLGLPAGTAPTRAEHPRSQLPRLIASSAEHAQPCAMGPRAPLHRSPGLLLRAPAEAAPQRGSPLSAPAEAPRCPSPGLLLAAPPHSPAAGEAPPGARHGSG